MGYESGYNSLQSRVRHDTPSRIPHAPQDILRPTQYAALSLNPSRCDNRLTGFPNKLKMLFGEGCCPESEDAICVPDEWLQVILFHPRCLVIQQFSYLCLPSCECRHNTIFAIVLSRISRALCVCEGSLVQRSFPMPFPSRKVLSSNLVLRHSG